MAHYNFSDLHNAAKTFLRSASGNVAILATFMLPVISGATFYAVDYAETSSQSAELQRAADAAALSAAREMGFVYLGDDDSEQSNETLTAIATGIAKNALGEHGSSLRVNASKLSDEQVRVTLDLDVDSTFGSFTGQDTRTLSAMASAEVFYAQNICVLLLQGSTTSPAAQLDDSAQINADKCGLHSNGRSPGSIIATSSTYLGIDYICTRGGYEGGDGNVKTPVITDCPAIKDPLRDRNLEPVTANPCTNSIPSDGTMIPHSTPGTYEISGRLWKHPLGTVDYKTVETQVISGGSHTLDPGTYCGGLVIEGNADVWMKPGIYHFSGGPLVVSGDARLSGENVGLYHDDNHSYFQFLDNAEIELSAPKTGQMAGILFTTGPRCMDQECFDTKPFTIESSKVRSLLGTIYIPKDSLTIDTTMPVSEEAAFTIVVADRLFLSQSPTLVLNTDYSATEVPPPGEFTDVEPKIRLME